MHQTLLVHEPKAVLSFRQVLLGSSVVQLSCLCEIMRNACATIPIHLAKHVQPEPAACSGALSRESQR